MLSASFILVTDEDRNLKVTETSRWMIIKLIQAFSLTSHKFYIIIKKDIIVLKNFYFNDFILKRISIRLFTQLRL